MIEVRIRHESDVEAVHLCTWPATDLTGLLPMLRSWSIAGFDDREWYPNAALACGDPVCRERGYGEDRTEATSGGDGQ